MLDGARERQPEVDDDDDENLYDDDMQSAAS
jgi:hypothetical protein